MDLQQLITQLQQQQAEPPLDKWNPEFCGDMDMIIKADGTWFYMGTPITRERLVALFASVLVIEDDKYYLKTPVEKIGIQVEDAPFVITSWQHINTDDGQAIEVATNTNKRFILSEEYPLFTANDQLYIKLHRGLTGKVHRNVYYQWAEFAEPQLINNQQHMVIRSGQEAFSLGVLE